MRLLICSAEIRTRSFGSVMELTLSAEFIACANRSEMYVSSSGFARYGVTEGEVGDVFVYEVFEQPAPFRLIRVKRHIHTTSMVKSERPVGGGLTHGAYREGFAELLDELGFNAREG